MRFNDREMVKIGEGTPTLEGILHHMKPQGNDWSDWYQQPSFKERTFKLVANLLFYYRVNEPEPLGILVLENAQIAYERPHKGIPFSFSITFKVNDKFRDNESKHIFSCRCQEDVNKWVSALKMSSYEHWRTQYIILKTKLCMRTGQDPVLNYLRNKQDQPREESKVEKSVGAKKSTFHSHLDLESNDNGQRSTFYDQSGFVNKGSSRSRRNDNAISADLKAGAGFNVGDGLNMGTGFAKGGFNTASFNSSGPALKGGAPASRNTIATSAPVTNGSNNGKVGDNDNVAVGNLIDL